MRQLEAYEFRVDAVMCPNLDEEWWGVVFSHTSPWRHDYDPDERWTDIVMLGWPNSKTPATWTDGTRLRGPRIVWAHDNEEAEQVIRRELRAMGARPLPGSRSYISEFQNGVARSRNPIGEEWASRAEMESAIEHLVEATEIAGLLGLCLTRLSQVVPPENRRERFDTDVQKWRRELREEVADTVIALMGLATNEGFDLWEAVEQRFTESKALEGCW